MPGMFDPDIVLPPHWVRRRNPNFNCRSTIAAKFIPYYFENTATGATSWTCPGATNYSPHSVFRDSDFIISETQSSAALCDDDDDAMDEHVDDAAVPPVDAPAGTTTVAHAADDIPAFEATVSHAELEEVDDDAAEAAALDDMSCALLSLCFVLGQFCR